MKLNNGKKKTKWKVLKYETKEYIYDSQQYETVRYFGDSIFTKKANIVETEEDQSNY